MSDPNLTEGQGPNPDASGYTPGTKSHVLNELHCMLQEFEPEMEGLLWQSVEEVKTADHLPVAFDFELAFELIESVRDKAGE